MADFRFVFVTVRNLGAKLSKYEWLVMIDDDSRIHNNFIKNLHNVMIIRNNIQRCKFISQITRFPFDNIWGTRDRVNRGVNFM